MSHDIQFLISILLVNLVFLPIWLFIWNRQSNKNKQLGFKHKKPASRKFQVFILVEYFICLVAVTIIPLPFSHGGSPYLNLDFFHQTYNNLLSAWYHTSSRTVWNEVENIIGNIVLFFPIGFLLPLLYPKRYNFLFVFIVAFICSFLIEAIQYFISINWGYNRIADIDDLTLNIIGAIIGYCCSKIYCYLFSKKDNKLGLTIE